MCLFTDGVLFVLLFLFLTSYLIYKCQHNRLGVPATSGSNCPWQVESHSCPHQMIPYISSGSLSCLRRKENDWFFLDGR